MSATDSCSKKIAFFSAHRFDKPIFDKANTYGFDITYLEPRLMQETMVLAAGYPVVCCFANDRVDARVIQYLADNGTQLLAMRCAGFNNVDVKAAKAVGLPVVRVPAYSPHAVAEFAVAMILTLNRKTHKAYNLVREQNFSLDGLMGFDLYGKTVGVIGTGKIGQEFCRIMLGFGCEVLAYDPQPSAACQAMGVSYVDKTALYQASDIISLHCPLNKQTHHLIDNAALNAMKPGVMLINTGRGALIHTKAVIGALKTQKIAYLGLDVYEEEEGLFFEDLSEQIITDDVFARLQTFPNVLITSHQAFFTHEAVDNIAATTLANVHAFQQGQLQNAV